MITPQAPARLALLGLAGSTIAALLLGWARAEEGNLDDSPEWPRRERLELSITLSWARLRFKEGLTTDLEKGQVTLSEAAARLAAYHAKEPRMNGMTRGSDVMRIFPGRTEEERCARCLASRARALAVARPSANAERIATRLERELADAYEP